MRPLERRSAAEVEHARRHVLREDLFRDHRTGRQARPPGDERDADAGLVHGALVDHAVLALEEAVVAHEDDDCVLELAGGLEEGDEAADAVVNEAIKRPAANHAEAVRQTLQAYASYIAADITTAITPEQVDRLALMSPYASGASIKDIVNESLTGMVGATSPKLHLELMIARLLVEVRPSRAHPAK